MKCKICSTQFHHCSSCDPDTPADFGLCGMCWSKWGFGRQYEAINDIYEEAKDILQEEINAFAKEKNP